MFRTTGTVLLRSVCCVSQAMLVHKNPVEEVNQKFPQSYQLKQKM